jgi:hypothetical protein
MFDTVNNAYNVDKKIDYSAVRSMVIRSRKNGKRRAKSA